MNQLNHLFEFRGQINFAGNGFIPSGAKCIYCDRYIIDLWMKLKNVDLDFISENFSIARLEFENDRYNKYVPCLTEEEFLIKQIIE